MVPPDFDLLGVDGYNRYVSRQWSPFETMFVPAREAAVAVGKGLMIGEYGCAEQGTNAEAKAAWFTDAGNTIESWPEVPGGRLLPLLLDELRSGLLGRHDALVALRVPGRRARPVLHLGRIVRRDFR